MKKLLFIICVLSTLLPTIASAQEPYAVLSQENTVLTFYYDDQKTARGGMSVGPFSYPDYQSWYVQRDSITTAVFDDSFANCTSITSTAHWFYECKNLTTITGIANLNTSNVTSTESMFRDCSGLTSLDVSGFNTSNVTIMTSMFDGCSSLTSLDVSHFNTSNVTNMYYMFYGCSGLTSLDVSGFNTSNVMDMRSMFSGCSGLTSLDVSGFNTSNVTYISGMFSDCSSLTSFDVSGFNTSNVTGMSMMFYGCSGLTSLDVSHFDTSKVTNMISMFDGCSGLTSLDVSGFNTSNVTDMSRMFDGCSGLTSLDVSGFNTSNVTSMFSMFYGCSSLTSLDVSGFNTSNVTNMGYMFRDCSGLTSLDVSHFDTSNVTDMSNMFANCSKLQTIFGGSEWSTAAVTDGSEMFYKCTSLVGGAGTTYDANHTDHTYAHIDGGTANPGYFTDKNATISFADANVKAICVQNWDTDGDGELSYSEAAAVQSIGEVFAESKITTFNEFRYFKEVKELKRNTFYMCDSLREVTLPNSLLVIGPYAFAKSPLLQTVDIPQTVEVIQESAFEGCTGLTNIILPDSLSELGGWAIGDCTSLTSITIPKKITSLSRRLLYRNTGLTSVTLPETLTYIGESVFEGCTGLKEIFIPQSVTEIGPNAFTSSGLTTVTIPSGVTKIDQRAFHTETLEAVTSEIETPFEIESSIFTEYTYANATLFVPEGKVDAYNNTSAWNLFQKIRVIGSVSDPEPYAVLSENNTILTFYYDDQKTARGGLSVGPFSSPESVSWYNQRSTINTVVFDSSFANCTTITSTAYWFYECTGLMELNTVDYLNTSNVTDMNSMLAGCSTWTVLNFSNFNTSKVTNMSNMFAGNSSLYTVYIGDGWNTNNVTSSSDMFSGCTNIMGGNGTTYNENYIDKTYARADRGIVAPGYLTNSSLASVERPSFMFSGDSLEINAYVNNPQIRYAINGFSTAEEAAELKNNMPVTMDSTLYTTPFLLKSNAVVKAFVAVQQDNEWITSAASTLVYDYNAWQNLKTAVHYGDSIYNVAKTSTSVDTQLLEQLQWAVEEGNHFYFERAMMEDFDPNEITNQINELIDQVKQQMGPTPTQQVATPTFSLSESSLAIETTTQDADINYTMTGRLLPSEDSKFIGNSLPSQWKVSGDNMTYGNVAEGGYNNTNCLKLTSGTNSTFESAQARYDFKKMLPGNQYYKLFFKARSESGEGKIVFYCENDTLDGTRSAIDTLVIGSELTDYEVTLKMTNNKTNQMVFNFGGLADTYYLDNVLFGAVLTDTTQLGGVHYDKAIELNENYAVKAVASKQGMKDSKPAIFDSYYDGWTDLIYVCYKSAEIAHEVYGNPNVPMVYVDQLKAYVQEAYYLYSDQLEHEYADSDIANITAMLGGRAYEIMQMMEGFTIDGVSYHAVDSTQVEVIPSLSSIYSGAINVASQVHFNDIDFNVTSVRGDAFANSRLGAIIWNPTFTLSDSIYATIGNPNLLFYTPSAEYSPSNVQNLIVNGEAEKIVLTDVTEGNNNFYCPQPFTAKQISYSRDFKQQTQIGVSRGWETIALPFDVQTITHETKGAIAPFGNSFSNKHFWLRTLTDKGMMSAQSIEANKAYLISMPNSTEYPEEYNLNGVVTFSAENVIVPETNPVISESSEYALMPTFESIEASDHIYALNVGEQREGYPEGSVFERGYRTVRPFEAYTEHLNDQTPAPRFITVDGQGNDSATDIIEHRADYGNGADQWYSIDGRKLQGKPTTKGVYIQNGKKIIVK